MPNFIQASREAVNAYMASLIVRCPTKEKSRLKAWLSETWYPSKERQVVIKTIQTSGHDAKSKSAAICDFKKYQKNLANFMSNGY